MRTSSHPPRPRALFVAALLLLTLALAGAIAVQAYRNFLGHKATAERVLRDYARLAAARFANRTEMALYYHAFWPALDALSRAKAGQPETELPGPSRLPVSNEPHAADFRKLARYTFRYDLLRDETILWVVPLCIVVFAAFGLYQRLWTYVGQRDYETLVRAVVDGLFASQKLDAMVYPTSSRRPGLIGRIVRWMEQPI